MISKGWFIQIGPWNICDYTFINVWLENSFRSGAVTIIIEEKMGYPYNPMKLYPIFKIFILAPENGGDS